MTRDRDSDGNSWQVWRNGSPARGVRGLSFGRRRVRRAVSTRWADRERSARRIYPRRRIYPPIPPPTPPSFQPTPPAATPRRGPASADSESDSAAGSVGQILPREEGGGGAPARQTRFVRVSAPSRHTHRVQPNADAGGRGRQERRRLLHGAEEALAMHIYPAASAGGRAVGARGGRGGHGSGGPASLSAGGGADNARTDPAAFAGGRAVEGAVTAPRWRASEPLRARASAAPSTEARRHRGWKRRAPSLGAGGCRWACCGRRASEPLRAQARAAAGGLGAGCDPPRRRAAGRGAGAAWADSDGRRLGRLGRARAIRGPGPARALRACSRRVAGLDRDSWSALGPGGCSALPIRVHPSPSPPGRTRRRRALSSLGRPHGLGPGGSGPEGLAAARGFLPGSECGPVGPRRLPCRG